MVRAAVTRNAAARDRAADHMKVEKSETAEDSTDVDDEEPINAIDKRKAPERPFSHTKVEVPVSPSPQKSSMINGGPI
jgi:hypothetical protein